jgi:DNA polymerase-3 subunit delta
MTSAPNSRKGLKSFAPVERFLTEIRGDARRAGYVLLGDEAFLYGMCRAGVIEALVPEEWKQFCLHDLDLATTSIFEALDLAQTPSLMAPFQVLFLRNVKTLYGRGTKKEEFAAIDAYFRRPNPQALVLFVADHIGLPQDLRRMDMTDKERAEKIRETLADGCGIVELQRVSDDDAIVWVRREAETNGITFTEDAARELVDALSAEMLMVASELEKLLLYAGAMGQSQVEVADVETMVSAAKQRSLYELTDAISLKDAPRALALLSGLLNASEGGEDAAIGHIFTLAKTFRQMLPSLPTPSSHRPAATKTAPSSPVASAGSPRPTSNSAPAPPTSASSSSASFSGSPAPSETPKPSKPDPFATAALSPFACRRSPLKAQTAPSSDHSKSMGPPAAQ